MFREAINSIHDPVLRAMTLICIRAITGVTVICSLTILAVTALKIWGGGH